MIYYNEIDPQAAAWLRELIRQGHLPAGDVDERSIEDVRPVELLGYTQCHFFAGIGRWPLALRLAGWPDDRPVWTGSCPCQPFSVAGARGGTDDPRHLWPAFRWLIDQCRPAAIFGEQVTSKAGREWLAGVRTDLEAMGYAVEAADLCAAGIGAPHIRQRLFWMAAAGYEQTRRGAASRQAEGGRALGDSAGCGERGGLADAPIGTGQQGQSRAGERAVSPGNGLGAGGLADTSDNRLQRRLQRGADQGREAVDRSPGRDRADRGPWDAAVWIECGDGKARRIEPGIAPLAHGLSARVVRLRGYGNAIVPQCAQVFIELVLEARP